MRGPFGGEFTSSAIAHRAYELFERDLVISGKNRIFDHRSRDVRPTEICRSLDLRAEIEPSKATATFIDGRLEVTLPKAAAGRQGPSAGQGCVRLHKVWKAVETRPSMAGW